MTTNAPSVAPSTNFSPSSLTPETDEAFEQRWGDLEICPWKIALKMERERNEEMGFRGQWCDKARKAEAALDALEDLTRELAATKKTLGTLIVWSGVDLGSENVERLLAMMSPENV